MRSAVMSAQTALINRKDKMNIDYSFLIAYGKANSCSIAKK
jgi:hypothetical protein